MSKAITLSQIILLGVFLVLILLGTYLCCLDMYICNYYKATFFGIGLVIILIGVIGLLIIWIPEFKLGDKKKWKLLILRE